MAEKIRQRRPAGIPQDEGLYRFSDEHDACGVGMVVQLSGQASRDTVLNGLMILRRLLHRGAAGSDPLSGDGAGILTMIPHGFFQRELEGKLPEAGKYAMGMVFNGLGQEVQLERFAAQEGLRVIAWRKVPGDKSQLGSTASESCPEIRQIFVAGIDDISTAELERRVFILRRRMEQEEGDIYFASFSTRTVVYKGLMLAPQIERFYTDLADEEFTSSLAIVHQRYSTNTFPAWQLAHPFRCLAHNGEINTVRGNLAHLHTRESYLASELFGEDLHKVLPLIDESQNDSACLDNMAELLMLGGRSLPHAMLMLMPQAWGVNYHLGKDVRGFFDYHSALMEPWDGPAAVAFTDGKGAGAMLDRNGLRPARYSLTDSGMFVLASETGVLDLEPSHVVRRGRLKPGEILWCDMESHRLILDTELKNSIARQQPYRRWAAENKIPVSGMFDTIMACAVSADLRQRQRIFGWSSEDIELILKPMARTAHEPVGSMGNDAPPAVLSRRPQLLFNYFKQKFAQVTNPPIDPIREELVMSLTTYIGNQGNILSESEHRASLIRLARPILTDEDLARLLAMEEPKNCAASFSMAWQDDLQESVKALQEAVVKAVKEDGVSIVILSDRELRDDEYPIPSLLAAAAVHRALTDAGLRPPVGVIIQSGEVREVMHYALLLGYGATAVHPYLALESVADLAGSGKIGADPAKATENYILAVAAGLRKIMSKMGIATLRSYRSAQLFEALGLGEELIRGYFPRTVSPIGGIGLEELSAETKARVDAARAEERPEAALKSAGQYNWRHDGETHLVTPLSICQLHNAVMNDKPEAYRDFAAAINSPAEPVTLRGLFKFRKVEPIPVEEVEPVESIIHHFVSGAMSLGALSPEAHETIAVAMNRIGCMSNSGEGGEGLERNQPTAAGENRASAIRQIASGRFGVTIDYLVHAKDLQIKMAQGAKPGEGGQLPGDKVDEEVARVRHSTPHVTLISPPPHHDIYSIEDLAQLIYDLRASNPGVRVSVKLVAESGVGTIAAGVAKAHADVIVISGHDGGTGAAPLSSIKHAGVPWEIGLAETQQTLVKNGLRGKVKLQVDGQIRTGRDVIVGTLLGAEEFGFATSLLLCLGCMMLRQCQSNSCAAGITTQDPEIRKRFKGRPEYIINYLRFIATEVREQLAALGMHSLDEAVGRADLLEFDAEAAPAKARGLDFAALFHRPAGDELRWDGSKHPSVTYDDVELIPAVIPALKGGRTVEISRRIQNTDRSVGTRLSGQVALSFGGEKLPDDSVVVDFQGTAGQSFGAFLAKGITMRLVGEANDYVGKGISGGKIVVRQDPFAPTKAEENVIAGNVIGYGGTSGQIFLGGLAGERFAIRNSGFTAVVEGVGDHGCEYMTGGCCVVLGPTGVNFAAGMTGGTAYVYDEDNDFDLRCNLESVDLEPVMKGSPEEAELLDLIAQHRKETGSTKAALMLEHWDECRGKFIRVMPVEYRNILKQRQAAK